MLRPSRHASAAALKYLLWAALVAIEVAVALATRVPARASVAGEKCEEA